MIKLAPLALTLLLTACSGSQKTGNNIEQDPIEYEDPPDPNAKKNGDANAAGHITVVPITISDGQQLELAIQADGSIMAGGQKVGAVTVKGEMLHANGGLLATLNPDGSITKAHVKGAFLDNLIIDKSGVFNRNDKALVAISDDGVVSAGNTGFIKLEGPAEGRQAAMFVLAVALAPQLAQVIETAEAKGGNPCGGDGNPCANPCGGN